MRLKIENLCLNIFWFFSLMKSLRFQSIEPPPVNSTVDFYVYEVSNYTCTYKNCFGSLRFAMDEMQFYLSDGSVENINFFFIISTTYKFPMKYAELKLFSGRDIKITFQTMFNETKNLKALLMFETLAISVNFNGGSVVFQDIDFKFSSMRDTDSLLVFYESRVLLKNTNFDVEWFGAKKIIIFELVDSQLIVRDIYMFGLGYEILKINKL